MSRKKKLIINLIILSLVCIYIFGIECLIRFTPLEVHKALEKKSHYGPSEIINTLEYNNRVINLCKYNDWYSVDAAEKNKFGLWQPSTNQSNYVSKNNKNKPLTINSYYSGQAINEKHTRYEWIIWGVINDDNIKDVRLIIMDDGNLEVLEENNMKDGTYIFRWESSRKDYEDSDLMVVGLDENENSIYKVK